jgi:hypothetical protein
LNPTEVSGPLIVNLSVLALNVGGLIPRWAATLFPKFQDRRKMMKQTFPNLFLVTCLVFNSCTHPAISSNTNPIAGASTASPSPASISPDPTPKSSATSVGKETDVVAQALESRFTNLGGKGCQTIKDEKEGPWIEQKCPGIGGYKMLYDYSDGRIGITLISSKGTKHDIDFNEFVESYTFLEVDPKLEWLLKRQEKELAPIALIIRYNAGNVNENTNKYPLYLMVVKITATEICVVDIVKAVDDTNIKVKQTANEAFSKTCLEPPQR